jgi:hypothetical protein
MQKIKHITLAFILGLGILTLMSGPAAFAANAPGSGGGGGCTAQNGRFLTLPTWYRGLDFDSTTCTVKLSGLNDIWKIALNLIEIMLQVAGYVAGGYMVWGGFKYIKSQGNPQNIASAKGTLMNAAIGLGIALSSVGIVNFVASRF